MLDGLLPDARVGMGQAAKLIVIVLKEIGIDRADAHTQALGFLACGGPIVRLVPRDMQRDRWAGARDTLDHRGVCQFFVIGCAPRRARQRL